MMTNNNRPVNIIQYKYHEEEFGKLLNEAFTVFTSSENQKLTIFTRDKPVQLNMEPLFVFSPFLRSILDSITCCSRPSILLPDCSSLSLQHLLNIVQYGATDFRGELNTAEILVAAKCLTIDLTNFEYVKTVKTQGSKEGISRNSMESGIKHTKILKENYQSDSDLDESVVDDYGEDIDEEMDRYKSSSLGGCNPLKRKLQASKVLENEHYDKETLDENPEDGGSLALHERYDKPAVPHGKKSTNMSKKSNSISTEDSNQPKFRIPQKKVECVPGKQDPRTLQYPLVPNRTLASANLPPNFGVVSRNQPSPQQWATVFSSSSAQQGPHVPLPKNQTVSDNKVSQNYVIESLRPQQEWSVVSNQPFSQTGPSRSQYEGQMRAPPSQLNPQRNASVPPRLPNIRSGFPLEDTFYAGQQRPPTPRPHPQTVGLWAQSAGKPPSQSFLSNPNMASVHLPSGATGQPDRTNPTSEIPPSTTTNICQLCHKTFNSTAQLWQHFARVHFFAELKADYGYMVDIPNKSCNECGSTSKSVDTLFMHIGTVHRKVNEIMEKKGLAGLKMPVLRTRKSM